MAYLIFVLVALVLLGGFFLLTRYETEHGVRFFAPLRARLDRNAERLAFVLAHVDLAAFLRDEVRRLMHRLGHDAVHLSLQAVRAVERVLTRLIRHFHTRHAIDVAPRETARPFVKTLSDFKGRLKATHPEISDIP
ncbi:MAG TPA: hypothetical protein PLW99_02465 [Candidatus Paceibacterota bacterium]|nr:hypothetical protein [Candidatus Paceibacterota bacterium]